MMRGAVCVIALLHVAPLYAAEGGLIRSGEQAGFSRIVMAIEPTTEWSLETSADRAQVSFPGKALDFKTTGIFDKIPRTRITDVIVESGETGTRILVKLGCDCRVSTSFVGAQYLALDVSDRETAQPTETTAVLDSVSIAETTPGPQPEEPISSGQDTAVVIGSNNDHLLENALDQAGRAMSADIENDIDPGNAEDLAKREEGVVKEVYAAEEALLRQIERAASQGLLRREERDYDETTDLAEADPFFAKTEPPGLPFEPSNDDLPPALPVSVAPKPAQSHGLDGLSQHEQIEATTVFDRYSSRAPDRIQTSQLPAECVPDHRLDIAYWAVDRPMFEQLPDVRHQIYGEFDKINQNAVNDLARLYLRFGFGAEAESLLNAFGAESAEKRLYIDLARIMDGRDVSPYGPLSRNLACPGRHGLWLAIAGTTPAFRDEAHFNSVEEAFSDLPPDMRMHVAPRLIGNLIDGKHPFEARMIYDIVTRIGDAPSSDLKLSAARLAAMEGDPVFAMQAMSSLVESGAPNADEALKHLVELGLDGGYAIPDRTVIDLRAAAHQYRGTDLEHEFRALVAKALAARAELEAAISEIRAAKSEIGQHIFFDTVAVAVLAESDPQRVGLANYARIVLSSTDFLSGGVENDVPREQIARHLLDLGLARAAEQIVMPAAGRRAEGKLLLAQAYLTQGDTETARKVINGMPGPEAADLRARSYFLDSNFSAAQDELDTAGSTVEADAMAWPSGDWERAQRTANNPAQASMAEFMVQQLNGANSIDASPNPEELAPEEAFVEPLPQLNDPSLDAARRLLATGNQLEDFVNSLLEEQDEAE
ncbi:MAG: hypothetical protein AAGG56_01840 [Pseudomonadota bacterium]